MSITARRNFKSFVGKKSLLCLLVLTSLLIHTSYIKLVKAVSGSCSASITPTSVTSYSENTFVVTVQNTGSTTYNYVKVTPTSRFSTIWANVTDWSEEVSGNSVILTGATLTASSSVEVNMNSRALGGSASSAESWTVVVSDDAGSNTLTCTGTINVAITSGGTDAFGPIISNISVSDVTDSSAKINWTTDEDSDSTVYYGTTDSYGSGKSDTSQTTSHGVTLTSLSANTTYHFSVVSVDASGNSTTESDFTFASSKQQQTVTTTTTTTVTKVVADTTLPGLNISTKLSGAYKTAPKISGTATDDAGVSLVHYSIDDGTNWIPVDYISSVGGKSVDYNFTPGITDDGNYKIRIKAVDPSGNEKVSSQHILIIDRFPPLVGGVIYSAGSLVLEPRDNNSIFMLPHLNQKITISASGGPNSMEVLVGNKVFEMKHNFNSGFWEGELNFDKPGIYDVNVSSRDSVDNITDQKLSTINVLPEGKVLADDKPIKGATISIYYFLKDTKRFVLWDSRAFGFSNPVTVNDDGLYSLFLPPGKFYLKVEANGFTPLYTKVFTIDTLLPINSNFTLQTKKVLHIGNLNITVPTFVNGAVDMSLTVPNYSESKTDYMKNSELPYFNLTDGDSPFTLNSIRGKPTLITVMNTWHPLFSEQIQTFTNFNDSKYNIVVISPQESVSWISVVKKKAKYNVKLISDPDGQFISEAKIGIVPIHLFVDRRGVVQTTLQGLISKNKILKTFEEGSY